MAAPASKRPRLSRDQALADDASNEPVSQALLNASRFANSVAPPPSHNVVWAANVPVVCAPTPGGVAVVNAITSKSCQLRPAHFDLAQHRQRRLPKPNLVSLSCSGTTLLASFAAPHDEVPGAPIAEETINLEPRARMVKSRTFCWVRSGRDPWNRWKEVALPVEVRDGGSEMVHASWCGQKADWRLAPGLGDPSSFAEGGSSNHGPRRVFVQTAAAGPTPTAPGSEAAILVNARGDVFVLRRAFSKSPFQLWRSTLLSSTITLRSSGETLFETTLGDEEHFVHHRIDQIAACPVPGEPTLMLAFSLRATSQGLDSGSGSHDVTPDPLATSPNNAAAAALLAQAQISTTPNAGRTPGTLVGTATSIGATHVLDDSLRGWVHLREIRVGLEGVHSEPFISTRTLEPISLAPSDGARPLSRPRHLQWHVPYPSPGSNVSASLRLFAGYSGDSDPLHTTLSSASIRSWRVERTSSQLVDAFNSLECKKSELPPPTLDWSATSSVSCELGAVKLEGMATSLSVNTLRICTSNPFDVDAQKTVSESRLYYADTLEPVEGTLHRLPPGARYLAASSNECLGASLDGRGPEPRLCIFSMRRHEESQEDVQANSSLAQLLALSILRGTDASDLVKAHLACSTKEHLRSIIASAGQILGVQRPDLWQLLRLLHLNASVWPNGATQPRTVLRLSRVCDALCRAESREEQNSSFALNPIRKLVDHVEWLLSTLNALARGALLLDAAEALSTPPSSVDDDTTEISGKGNVCRDASALLGLFILEVPRRLLCQALQFSLRLMHWLDRSKHGRRRQGETAKVKDIAPGGDEEARFEVLDLAHRRLLNAAAKSSVNPDRALEIFQSFTCDAALSHEQWWADPGLLSASSSAAGKAATLTLARSLLRGASSAHDDSSAKLEASGAPDMQTGCVANRLSLLISPCDFLTEQTALGPTADFEWHTLSASKADFSSSIGAQLRWA